MTSAKEGANIVFPDLDPFCGHSKRHMREEIGTESFETSLEQRESNN